MKGKIFKLLKNSEENEKALIKFIEENPGTINEIDEIIWELETLF